MIILVQLDSEQFQKNFGELQKEMTREWIRTLSTSKLILVFLPMKSQVTAVIVYNCCYSAYHSGWCSEKSVI